MVKYNPLTLIRIFKLIHLILEDIEAVVDKFTLKFLEVYME